MADICYQHSNGAAIVRLDALPSLSLPSSKLERESLVFLEVIFSHFFVFNWSKPCNSYQILDVIVLKESSLWQETKTLQHGITGKMSAIAFSSVYIFFAEYLAFVSQGLKFKISFHKVLGQGFNWEIVSAFEFNHMLDLDSTFLFVYQFMYLWRLCSLENMAGGLIPAISLPCRRGAEYAGWRDEMVDWWGEQGSRLN